MFTIDLTLKYSPIPVSVQRKEEVDALAVYKQVVAAMKASQPQLVELTCEKQTEKKIALLSDQISAVIVGQKDGSSAAGRVPGFFSLADS